ERPAICALRERAGFIAQRRAYTNNAAFSESFPQDIQRTLAVLARHATAAGCFAQRERKPDDKSGSRSPAPCSDSATAGPRKPTQRSGVIMLASSEAQ